MQFCPDADLIELLHLLHPLPMVLASLFLVLCDKSFSA
jgi:hypothetical protein